MEKEIIIAAPPAPPQAQQGMDAPAVRTLPIDEARKLIRKTSKQHAELFRLLAK